MSRSSAAHPVPVLGAVQGATRRSAATLRAALDIPCAPADLATTQERRQDEQTRQINRSAGEPSLHQTRGTSLPELIDLIWNRQIDPGKVFDLELSLEDAAKGYQEMDARHAIKALLKP